MADTPARGGGSPARGLGGAAGRADRSADCCGGRSTTPSERSEQRAVRPCPSTTPAPPAVGNPAASGGSPAVQRLFEHGCADRAAVCCGDKRRLPTLANAPADRCPLTTPHPPARGTRGARCRLPSWPARAPTRRPARPTRRQPPGHLPRPPAGAARTGPPRPAASRWVFRRAWGTLAARGPSRVLLLTARCARPVGRGEEPRRPAGAR